MIHERYSRRAVGIEVLSRDGEETGLVIKGRLASESAPLRLGPGDTLVFDHPGPPPSAT